MLNAFVFRSALVFSLTLSLSVRAADDKKDTYPYWRCDASEVGKAKMKWPEALKKYANEVNDAPSDFVPTTDFAADTALRQLAKSVARVEILLRDKEGREAGTTCTGTAISEDHVLTNTHCVPGDEAQRAKGWKVVKVYVRFGYYAEGDRGEVFEADPVPLEFNGDRDYALLNVRGNFEKDWGHVKLGSIKKREPEHGDKLAIIHHPAGLPQKISTDCTITSGPKYDEFDVNVVHDCASKPGSSGSPIFRKQGDGYELLTLHFASDREVAGRKYAMRLDRIAQTGHHFSRLLPQLTGDLALVMTAGQLTDQRYLLSESAPFEWMDKVWKEGFRITDWTGLPRNQSPTSEATSEHLVVMSKGPDIKAQTYYYKKDSEAFPLAWLKDRLAEDYRLSSCGYAQNSWVVVVSKMATLGQQMILGPVNAFPDDDIKDYLDKGYKITSVCKGYLPSSDAAWVVALTRTSAYKDQVYSRTKKFPFKFIREKWDAGYRITAIESNGEWVVVMSKGPSLKDAAQTYFYRSYFPTGGILSGFDDKLLITGAGGF